MERADVVVVGAGVFGASIGSQLVRRRAGRVVLVDPRGVAGGMSGRTFNQVRLHYSNELTVRLASRGIEVLRAWSSEVGVGDPGYVPIGYLLLVPPRSVEACRGNVELARGLGVDARFLEPSEISAVEPLVSLEGIAGAAFEPDGGVIDAARMTRSWVDAGVALGLEPRFGVAVEEILTSRGRVDGVRLSDGGRISTAMVVNAAGCWARELMASLRIDLPIELFRLQMGYVRQAPEAPRLGVTVTDSARGLVMRPDAGPVALAALYEPDAPHPAAPTDDDDVSAGFESLLRSAVAAAVPAYANASWERGVSGLYDATPDWHPILGWAPGLEGLYLAVGWSGHGLKLAPAVGEVVAAEVLGEVPSFDVSSLRFERGELMRLAYGPGARA